MGAFKCENEGVYNEVNDRSLSHEKRAQDVPLSSVWWSVMIENRIIIISKSKYIIIIVLQQVQELSLCEFGRYMFYS